MPKKQHIIPVVCTRGVVIFPLQDVVIEVGRQKSINAIEEAQSFYDGKIIVVSQKDENIMEPSFDDLYHVGTLCNIKKIRDKNGYLRVTFSGLNKVILHSIDDNSNFLFGNYSIVKNNEYDEKSTFALLQSFMRQTQKFNKTNLVFPPEIISVINAGRFSIDELVNVFGQYYPMHFSERQKLFELMSVDEQLFSCIATMKNDLDMEQLEQAINQKLKERIDSNQKEYYLRERMRILREELGDSAGGLTEIEQLKAMIENNPYPQYVKDKALEELARYEMVPTASAESGVIRNYIDWLLKTPWYQETTDEASLVKVREILDQDHFGLEKVKERIMEYLAVKQQTNSLKAPILCLVGPPGVGKTSLAKSIARALNREFVKISLGGVRDEAEIRGHRRTYLGAMPGRLIQGMKKAGVINPVFLIDEIDKMASDYKGDPASAMLEVLDPEQNSQFSDHYLEEPYDLSKVLFVATANYLENIPEPLRDRLEIIELSSYTEQEKLMIAQKYLIRKQCDQNGLEYKKFKLTDNLILKIIRNYTREAGVRQLERLIGSLVRKTVLQLLTNDNTSFKINAKVIEQFLGKPRFEYGKKEKKAQVGVVTGLAYTQYGGDILPIEVTTFPGKGRLILTGLLGDVMKESAEIALGYVRSHASKLKIDINFFDQNDVHIHVPEGAIPKDGPSAGVTLTTALISAITNHKVRSDIAMTGEITLRGHVLAIGGLKEKSLAAARVGINDIIVPKQNSKDLEDVPETVQKDLNFIFVDNIEQVMERVFVE